MKLENLRVNYQIIHFAKFCGLSDSMNNLSKEVMQFYLNVYLLLRDPQQINMKDPNEIWTRINVGDEGAQVEVVAQQRVHHVLKVYFQPLLPEMILNAFKKNVDTYLKVSEDGRSAVNWIDHDRFLDQSILLFLRFNKLAQHALNKLYFAWTLFTTDEMEFDQLYIMLKIIMPKANKLVSYTYPKSNQVVFKKLADVMQSIHDKFGIQIQSDRQMKQYQDDLLEKMNAVGGFE